MAKKPPRRNRRVNGDISVDLRDFLQGLSRALGWQGIEADLGRPGSYDGKIGTSDSPGGFAVDYLFKEIMSKFDDEKSETDTLKSLEALAKFREAEERCTETNLWFDQIANANALATPPDCDPDVWQAMLLARRKIENWLGPFDWNEVAAGFRFTGGASFGMPRSRSTPAHKYSKKMEITHSAEALAQAALIAYPTWGPSFDGDEIPYQVIEGNRLLCVPKNYKVHRVIAAEPSGNMFFQKGIGYALRRRLQAVGVDLRSQVMNQDFAFLGSVTDLVSTIDLSMASDTVSKGIVEWAIPPDWVSAMSLCRSPKGVLPSGDKVLYRKWSSMGNAYTFELETVLFLALAQSCAHLTGGGERFVTCYGDDIICPTRSSDLLIRVLKRCGFVPNEKKSFVSGPFRESCGKHYFLGIDVTPFYIRHQPRTLADLFLLCNNLERWRRRCQPCLTSTQDESLRALIRRYRSFAPSNWRRPRIPDSHGDGAFIGTFDECLPRKPKGKWLWWEGWQVEVMAQTSRRISEASASENLSVQGVMLAMLESMELGPPSYNSYEQNWLEQQLAELSGGVLPNRRRRWVTTTMIVAQF